MGSYSTGQPPSRHRGAFGVVVIVVALLIGLGGGYLLRYTTAGTSNAAPAATSTTTSPPSTTTAPANPPCTSAADVGAQILAQLRAAATAIGNLDPSGLQQVLNRVQGLQTQLEQAVRGCRGEVSPSAVPSPTLAPPTTS